MDDLVDRWRWAFTAYAALNDAAEAAVVRWEWTDFQRYNLQPMFFRRYPGRGRVLESQPDYGGYQYGFDAEGRVLIEGVSDNFGNWSDGFFSYGDDTVECIRYSFFEPFLPVEVSRYRLLDRRVTTFEQFAISIGPLSGAHTPDDLYALTEKLRAQRRDRQTYLYEGHRLVRVKREYEVIGLSHKVSEEVFTYDEQGRLTRIELLQTGQPSKVVMYRRPAKGQTHKTLVENVRKGLVSAVVDRLRQAALTELVYCVVLAYHAVDRYFPPLLMIGRESYRRDIMIHSGDEAHYSLYPPLEFLPELMLEVAVSSIETDCQLLEQQLMAAQDWDTATQVLRDVAADLMRLPWQDVMPVTDDFVVFAVDAECDDIGEAIAASCGAERLADLTARGLL